MDADRDHPAPSGGGSNCITVVGLGPGTPDQWTASARQALESAALVWVRTLHHPAARALVDLGIDVRTCDDLYEAAADLPSVYDAIGRRLLGELDSGSVVYAVPGDPAFGEATVASLRVRVAATSHDWREIHGVSFVGPTLAMLNWDAFDGLQVADATELASLHYPPIDPDRPALVPQVYSRIVAGDIKLALLAQYPPDHPVSLVIGAGGAGARRLDVPLHELDRAVDYDDYTTLAVPPRSCRVGDVWRPDLAVAPIGASLLTMAQMMARLRAPDGCPWDLEQSHDSLAPFLLEESHEALAALDSGDRAALCEELGDLLLQIVFHAQIAAEEGTFQMADVICGVTRKMVERHPHVFGSRSLATADEVKTLWEELKGAERQARGDVGGAYKGIASTLPALARAQAVQDRAGRAGHDSNVVDATSDQWVDEPSPEHPDDDTERRVGRELWAAVDEARRLGVDAETALRKEIARRLATFTGLKPGDGAQ